MFYRTETNAPWFSQIICRNLTRWLVEIDPNSRFIKTKMFSYFSGLLESLVKDFSKLYWNGLGTGLALFADNWLAFVRARSSYLRFYVFVKCPEFHYLFIFGRCGFVTSNIHYSEAAAVLVSGEEEVNSYVKIKVKRVTNSSNHNNEAVLSSCQRDWNKSGFGGVGQFLR